MNNRSRLTILAAGALWAALASLLPQQAGAIPVFARKYGFNCTMCHSSAPRLNDFGQRYRDNGYRLMDRENEERTVLTSPTPVALRSSAGYNDFKYNKSAGSEDLREFAVNGLDLMAGGLLGRSLGFFAVYLPPIGPQKGVAGQGATLEMANVVFSDLGRTPWLNLRVGRFEPATVAVSAKRELSVARIEAYDVGFRRGPTWAETRTGLEVTGHGRAPLRYAVGYVNGSATNRPKDSPSDVYARLACILGAGEGQTAGQRIGVMGYLGSARPFTGGKKESFTRFGVDAALNASILNLTGQFLSASDHRTLWFRADKNVTWWGAVAELTATPMVSLAGFARFDYVNMPKVDNRDVTRISAGARYYPEDNVALHGEVSHRIEKSLIKDRDDPTETMVTARVDFMF